VSERNGFERMHQKNILITGMPGVGKTTFIRNLIARLEGVRLAGFFTQEIREKGVRIGFELVGLDGERSILSHTGFKSRLRVSKYGVDVDGFEKFLDAQQFFIPEPDLILIDEIGKMECFSEKFMNLVTAVLGAEIPLVATISQRGRGFISEVKARKDVVLAELSLQSRKSLLAEVLGRLQSFLKQSAP